MSDDRFLALHAQSAVCSCLLASSQLHLILRDGGFPKSDACFQEMSFYRDSALLLTCCMHGAIGPPVRNLMCAGSSRAS